MTTIEERGAYLKNPYFTSHIFGDFSAFYVAIAVCTVFCVFLFALNIIIGCCSKHKHYWQDRHTGNRWLVSIWSATPHRQPPLDLTELKDVKSFQPIPIEIEHPSVIHQYPDEPRGFARGFFKQQQHYHHHHQQQQQQQHYSQQQQQIPEEYVELHHRESDI